MRQTDPVTQAGWYPDPAGQPQTFRYWDGTSWSQETTGDPYAPPPERPTTAAPPPPPPPTPPSSYGQVPAPQAGGYPPQQQYPPQQPYGGFPPAPAPGRSRGPGLLIALVVGAVLLLVGLSVAGFVGYRALDDDTGNDAGDDNSSAIDTDTAAPSESTTATGPTPPTQQQCTGGLPTPSAEPPADATEVSGGGLTIPVPRGYAPEIAYSEAFAWADDFVPLQKLIETADDYSWVSIYGVGALRKANGFDDPAQAAEAVMACMARSTDLYQYFTGREDLSSEAISVDGNDAHQITANLRVDDPNISLEGDVAQVVVVDTGDPDTFGVYITVVPIGDAKLISKQAAMVAEIDVD